MKKMPHQGAFRSIRSFHLILNLLLYDFGFLEHQNKEVGEVRVIDFLLALLQIMKMEKQ